MSANEYSIDVQDQVYVYTPAKKVGTAYKFACSFCGSLQSAETIPYWDRCNGITLGMESSGEALTGILTAHFGASLR